MKGSRKIFKSMWAGAKYEWDQFSCKDPTEFVIAVATINGITGAIVTGYQLGKETTYDRELYVATGCALGGIGYFTMVYLWPVAIPVYTIYKVAEVSSRH